MAQNARYPAKRAFFLMALALALPGLAAQAGETRDRPARIVLNGQLAMADFTGGVGRTSYDTGYYQASVYVAGSANSSYAATTAFVGAARSRAFAGGGMHSSGFGHH